MIISTLIHPVDGDYLLFRNHDVGMRHRHCLMREKNVKGASPPPTHFLCMVASISETIAAISKAQAPV